MMRNAAATARFPLAVQSTFISSSSIKPAFRSNISFRTISSPFTTNRIDPFRKGTEQNPRPEYSPKAHLHELTQNFEHARAARTAGKFFIAADFYRKANNILSTTIEHDSGKSPMSNTLKRGDQLMDEATIGAALFADSSLSPETVANLIRYIETIPPEDGTDYDPARSTLRAARGQISLALNTMNHALAADDPNFDLLSKALDTLQETRGEVRAWLESNSKDPELKSRAQRHREVDLFAALLSVEILGRQILHAHGRKDFGERDLLIDSSDEMDGLIDQVAAIRSSMKTNEHDELIASYIADVARLFLGVGRWDRALELARTLNNKYESCAATKELLKPKGDFGRFIAQGRLLTVKEYTLRHGLGKLQKWGKWIKTGLYMQHSKGLGQSAIDGGVGAASGGALGYAIAGSDFPVLAPVIGATILASVTTAAHRLWNGMNTKEAKLAAETGIYDRALSDTMGDLGGLALDGLKVGLLWGTLAALISTGANQFDSLNDMVATAPKDGFVNALDAVSGNPESTSNALNSILSSDAWEQLPNVLYHAYTKGAAALYFARFLEKKFPGIKRLTDNQLVALLMMPGMALFTAEFGTTITGSPDKFFDAVALDSVIGLEAIAMTRISGLATGSKQNGGLKPDDIFNTVNGMGLLDRIKALSEYMKSKNFNFTYPLAAMFTGGVFVGPIGGLIQNGEAVGANPLLAALQGALITVLLLPIAVIEAALLENIDIKGAIERAKLDFEDSSFFKRNGEALRAAFHAVYDSPMPRNRAGRSVTGDLFSATPRAMVGWYSPEGQLLASVINLICVNGWFTSMAPEIGDSMHERKVIREKLTSQDTKKKLKQLEEGRKTGSIRWSQVKDVTGQTMDSQVVLEEDLETLRLYLKKSGLLLHPTHIFQKHRSWRDNAWPLLSIRKAFSDQTFAQVPNIWLYTSLYRMLNGALVDRPTKRQKRLRKKYKAQLEEIHEQRKEIRKKGLSEKESASIQAELIKIRTELKNLPEHKKRRRRKLLRQQTALNSQLRGNTKEYQALKNKLIRTQDKLAQLPTGRVMANEVLSEGHVRMLFELIKADIRDPNAVAYLKPLVQTLAFSRDSKKFGGMITEFLGWMEEQLATNPDVAFLLDLELDDLVMPEGASTLEKIHILQRTIKMPYRTYRRNAMSMGRSLTEENPLLIGLFEGPPPISSTSTQKQIHLPLSGDN